MNTGSNGYVITVLLSQRAAGYQGISKVVTFPANYKHTPTDLRTGEPVYIYYKSSKNNERDEWKSGRILAMEHNNAIIPSYKTARTTKKFYEDISIKPCSEFTR